MHARNAGTVLALALLALSASAKADFHFMKVVEVFPGAAAAPNAQYVVLQMWSGGQTNVASHGVTVFAADGTSIGTVVFPNGVANGVSQDKILVATTEAAAFFSITADFVLTVPLPITGGKLCFDASPIDCFAWGSYFGSAVGVGTPFAQPGPFPLGRAAVRRLDIVGSPTVLDQFDDTDQSASDFVSRLPAPRNNARVNGTVPASTCGNGVLEGLEQCEAGRGCSATCTVDADALFFNGYE